MQQPAESLVAWVWQEARFSASDLCTVDGQPLQVVFRGQPGDGVGPDFRDAIVVIDGTLHRGDVEIHVRTSDWDAHGHTGDPRYRNVVLHVVLDDDRKRRRDLVPNRPPILELRPRLDAPLPILSELAQLEPSGPGLCGSFVGWTDEAVSDLLDLLGDDRFAEKVTRAETALDIEGPDQALHRGLLDALGVTRNRAPMQALAERIPIDVLAGLLAGKSLARRIVIAQAILLGAAGFLDRFGTAEQQQLWREYGDSAPPVTGWELCRVRPANHPARRLLAYGNIVAAAGEEGLFAHLLAGWPVAGVSGLRRRLATLSNGTLGAERSAAIVLDVLLPLIAARECGSARRDGNAWHAYWLAPKLAENALIRQMQWQLFAAPASPIVDRARRQQGLLHLYHTWCRAQRCAECPVSGGGGDADGIRLAGRPTPTARGARSRTE